MQAAVRRLVLCLLPMLCSAGVGVGQTVIVPDAERLTSGGRFTEAAEVLRAVLADTTVRWTAGDRRSLEFEIDRLHRIRLDYPLTRETLWEQVRNAMPDATPEEYDAWIAENRFDARPITDTLRFFAGSVRNLFWRFPDLRARRFPAAQDSVYAHAVWSACTGIAVDAAATGKPCVQQRRFRIRMSVEAVAGAAPDGSVVRAWLPFPRVLPHQHHVALVSSTPKVKSMNRDDAPIRSAYFEQRATRGVPTRFSLEATFTTEGVRFPFSPADAEPFDGADPEVRRYLGEAPHVVFTGKIAELAERLVGSETNPVIKARRFYDWIADSILYSQAQEYSTIRNLGDICLTRRYGDSGQQALLFITLCRATGIPARWQSGWLMFPGEESPHAWCEVYLPPWGWVPIDPSMAVMASRYFAALSAEQRRDIRDFYFGGLDQYRMAANADHAQELNPSRRAFRSDPVDFQRGELEVDDVNLYFDRWSCSFDVRPLPEALH